MSTIKVFGIETFIEKYEVIALFSCYFILVLLRIISIYPFKTNNIYIDNLLHFLFPLILYILLSKKIKKNN